MFGTGGAEVVLGKLNIWNGHQYYLIGAGPAGKQPFAHFRRRSGQVATGSPRPPDLKLSCPAPKIALGIPAPFRLVFFERRSGMWRL